VKLLQIVSEGLLQERLLAKGTLGAVQEYLGLAHFVGGVKM
jgi:hypothetical protein|tara:strand:+ start:110 stop:232 length:123 start_codon:yes stop_codon:yes gene_type:complete